MSTQASYLTEKVNIITLKYFNLDCGHLHFHYVDSLQLSENCLQSRTKIT